MSPYGKEYQDNLYLQKNAFDKRMHYSELIKISDDVIASGLNGSKIHNFCGHPRIPHCPKKMRWCSLWVYDYMGDNEKVIKDPEVYPLNCRTCNNWVFKVLDTK